ncbi:DUF262 domain-containing protein [Arthrobacter sp. H35-D1]|uniref:DUF262 domain-containing protein n=1 Tax=Arthrobacter sp. H35-D1 TaxID=3046202 RepID=UPI0024B916C2|nr:DUF262 domain-containing protein [Arthrobacter sp. H35-D1]MDJ0314497.1 DUF262 domain-containing protein [Arthrobacter sp. H35-D1]
MKSFDTRTYSISDFAEWKSSGLLVLSPAFQRRAVWTTKAKSYLIDTVLRGKPMPKVLITQSLVDGRSLRTVVDGQQRLRAILEYMSDDFAVMRTHNQEFAGMRYSDLEPKKQDEFWQYEIGVDVLFNTDLSELLDIFARLNTYSVKLNGTELLNATYLGAFKTTAHELGHKYAAYWREAGVFTDSQLARMGEVEMAADLLGALLKGISSRKQIPAFYREFDDSELDVEHAATLFEEIMTTFAQIYSAEDLRGNNFSRVHLFYSAFLAISSLLKGTPVIPLNNVTLPTVTDANLVPSRMRVALDDMSAQFDVYTSKDWTGIIPPDWQKFIQGSRRATTDQGVREARSRFIAERIAAA